MASSSGAPQTVHAGEAAKPMSNNTPLIKYDVFVSFRGEDIRDTFLSHLTGAFTRKQISAFVDDRLKKGDDIWSSLVEAIEGSSISLVIFSENYASSDWCLKELVKILECKEKYGQVVIPVFYKVEPSDVRHQREKYKKALTKLEGKHGFPMMQIWRQALNTSANLSGIESSKFRKDADLLEEIINRVLMSMPKYPVNRKGLIGMEKPIAILESLLCNESKEARVIGIWGMGGIGKTTIAEEIFNKKRLEYQGSYFLESSKDELQRHGIRSVKEKLFSKLLAEDVKIETPNGLADDTKRRIGRMKVLIVLDDVNDTDVVENIFGTLDWLQPGCRIIITTRDKQVLIANKVVDIYQVGALSYIEALELFNLSAFSQTHHKIGYYDLSQRVVIYTKGVPLVLKVLGRLLCGKSKEVWESQLDKLKKMSIKKVHDVMRLSYDDLDRKEKNILLDIACFFNGMKIQVCSLIKLLKDHQNDNSVVVGLERLKDRALVTISEGRHHVSMHDIIQEMGREIVRQESEDPGQRSRLWDPDDIYEVLKNNKGTEAIRSITTDFSKIWNLDLSPDIFVKMSKLQFLNIYGVGGIECLDLFPQWSKVWRNLKFLFWVGFPLESFPECFSTESLVRLELPKGRMRRLWHGVKNLVNLQDVVLGGCSFLEELPDFSKAINLEVLIVNDCGELKNVHPSIYRLNKLQILRLEGCVSLTEFTSDTCLSSLWLLSLQSCTSLRKLSITTENITDLHLGGIPANVMPLSFACQSKLEVLDISDAQYESLPSSIQNLTGLRDLGLSCCKELRSIPVLPPSLETLLAHECRSLKTITFPSTASEQFKENKKTVRFWKCMNLDERSLRDIGLNAQINLMKLTHQHSCDKDEYDFKALYLYPRRSVPKWLEYKTTKDEMIIDLSQAKLSPLLGFIFCFILAGDGSREYGDVKLEITITDGEGEGKKGYVMDSIKLATDHVCLIYDKKCSHYLTSTIKSQPRFKIKAATRPVKSETDEVMNLKLIEFGVSLVNTLTYDSFVQQIEFFDSINKCKHVMLSIILCIFFLQMKMKNLI